MMLLTSYNLSFQNTLFQELKKEKKGKQQIQTVLHLFRISTT
jgi:hypothetical protein